MWLESHFPGLIEWLSTLSRNLFRSSLVSVGLQTSRQRGNPRDYKTYIVTFFLNLRPGPAVLRDYSWPCSQETFLTEFRESYRVLSIKSGWQCVRQLPWLTYYLFSPICNHFYRNKMNTVSRKYNRVKERPKRNSRKGRHKKGLMNKRGSRKELKRLTRFNFLTCFLVTRTQAM